MLRRRIIKVSFKKTELKCMKMHSRQLFCFLIVLTVFACAKQEEEDNSSEVAPAPAATPSPKSLYVATGACYSGSGVTTFSNTTASNLVYRVNADTGVRQDLLADYFRAPANSGDSPVGISMASDGDLFVLVENTTTTSLRRIEKLAPTTLNRSTYNASTLALGGTLRRLYTLSGDWLLVSKQTGIEKVRDTFSRITQGTNPFIWLASPPAVSNCTTATTMIPDMLTLPSGLIVVLHAAAGKNGFAVISGSGYASASDCKNNAFQAGPTATAFPTSAVYDNIHKQLIVAYAGNSTAADVNSIYAYTIDEETGAITSPQKIYDSNLFGSSYSYLLYGVSAMALDAETGALYVATAVSNGTTVTNYRIERLTYDASKIGVANTTVLTKSGGTFYDYGSDTKCVSQMFLSR
jgi:hypothetical protein